MYHISYKGSYTLYDPRLDEYSIRSPSVHLAVNEAGSLSMVMERNHPNFSRLQKRKGIVELTSDGDVIYRGRVIGISSDWYNSATVRTEGLLACLNDSIVPPFSFPADFQSDLDYETAELSGNVVEYFLRWLLSVHNAQVGDEQKILLGNITVADPNNYVFRSSEDYTSTWSLIKGKLFGSSLGGFVLARYESDGTYLDYYADLPGQNQQIIEFGENLLDITSEEDSSDVFSAVIPIGQDGLTIDEEPDRQLTTDLRKEGVMVWSAAAREKYGYVTKVIAWTDVTETAHLVSKASAALMATTVAKTITVKACDLGLTEEDVAHFRVGKNTVIKSKPHSLSAMYPLVELDIDILDASNTLICLSLEKNSTGITDSMNTSVDSQTDQLFTELGRYYTKEQVNDKLTDKVSVADFPNVMRDSLASSDVDIGGTLTVSGVEIDGYARFA